MWAIPGITLPALSILLGAYISKIAKVAAATRARKSIGEIKKLVTDYRKQSVLESKRS